MRLASWPTFALFALGLCPATYNRLSLERRKPSRCEQPGFQKCGVMVKPSTSHETWRGTRKTIASLSVRVRKWHRESCRGRPFPRSWRSTRFRRQSCAWGGNVGGRALVGIWPRGHRGRRRLGVAQPSGATGMAAVAGKLALFKKEPWTCDQGSFFISRFFNYCITSIIFIKGECI